jgi:hypothetical protein
MTVSDPALPRAVELPERAQAELRAIRAELSSNARLRGRQRHLFARVAPPENLEPDEAWRVDLAAREFVHTRGGEPITLADAQLIATRGTDGTWLWAWRNPSVDSGAYAKLESRVSDVEHTAALLELDRFSVSDDDAATLAQWLAVKCGYFAAYPGASSGVTAWLALDPRVTQERTDGDPLTMWCSGCGRARHTVACLIKGNLGSICEHCVKLALHVRQETQLPDDLDEEGVATEMPPCLLSGQFYPRLFLPYTAIAWTTLDTLEDILREGGHLA